MNDLTLVGNIIGADGIGRHNMLIAKALAKSGLDINCKIIGKPVWTDMDKEAFPILSKPFNGYGKISIWTYIIGLDNNYLTPLHDELIKNSKKSFAYSMIESDQIPPFWKNDLNKYSGIIVPDPFLVDVYKKCGITKPIYVLPLPIKIDDFLELPQKKYNKDKKFVFGMTGSWMGRKGHQKVIDAFKKAFGDDEKYELRVHGRNSLCLNSITVGDTRLDNFPQIELPQMEDLKIGNIIISKKIMSRSDYIEWMSELDCFAFGSRGEGFSIVPREALAATIPTIILNHSAHKTICDSGFVEAVIANKKLPAIYEVFDKKQIGYYYDCELNDLVTSMKNVVDNYQQHLDKASKGREWVKQFTCEALAPKYIEFFKGHLKGL